MTDVAWLDERLPRPPEDLTARLRAEVAEMGEGTEAEGALLLGGRTALGRALAQPGRVRSAAFDLLAADALISYACEAALQTEDADRALARLVSIGGER